MFARPDPEWGEAVVAAVVARDGAPLDPEELRAFCRSRLAASRCPKAIEPVGALPRTASGKLRRGALRMTFDPSEYRVEARKRWGAQAAGWRRHADALRHATMPVTAWMVDAIAPQPGHDAPRARRRARATSASSPPS